MNFAVVTLDELTTLLVAIFGAFGAIMVGFYNYNLKREKAFSKIVDKLSKSIDHSTEAHNKVAEATERAAKEAEQRNGHLAELAIENTDKLMRAVAAINRQTVKEQTVKHQTIEKKD